MTARSVNNKYGAKKLIIDGETFDSRMEARRGAGGSFGSSSAPVKSTGCSGR